MIKGQMSVRSAFLVLAALVIVAVPLAGGRVGALTGDSDTTTSSDETPVATTTSVDSSTNDDTEVPARVQERINAAKQKAQTQVESARKNVQTKTQEKRQQLCENRKNAIDNKLKAFSGAADKHLARLNGAYAKLKDYQSSHNLTVGNYDNLIAAADAKQQAATEAVEALKSVSGGVDCSSADVSVQLKTVKEAAATTRNALKAYRTSLHDILIGLAQATKTTVQENTGGNE